MQLGSIKRLQIEDGIMACVLLAFCAMIVGLITVGRLGTNEIPLGTPIADIGPPSIADRVLGSKWVIITEQMWLATVWGCKACLMLLYNNMTTGLSLHHRLVQVIGIFTAASYLLIEICFFAVWCRPFHDYWAIPATTRNCSVYTDHMILVLSLNVATDLFMMSIPLPLLIQARLSLWKKITLCCVFSLGSFVIICCCLSKYYSLHFPYGAEWIKWYVREAGTATIVANIPQTWPLVRRLMNVNSFFSTTSFSRTRRTTNDDGYLSGSNVRLSRLRGDRMHSQMMHSGIDRTDSQEQINTTDPLQIWEHKQFQITAEEADEEAKSGDRSPTLEYNSIPFPERPQPRTTATVTIG
ncbi:hypothetical protein UA08_02992 [Talaromyces atroroseus]|uniref:Rhodopsin domain-containing protein n=1 Tax=Talaromyces atroroseus TaxID=1441469 RepID=A0A225AMM1_TALAT|nr:hypothetical protein UA08_02992 [Talaromyces atroroseus]OKL62140.1 hypothetical protein UA08_02992 [Talaromyces atroroseus]